MAVAHDIFAETNPAFCATLLATFSKAYHDRCGYHPEVFLCYTALPIALSGDLSMTFDGTNRVTGLLEWLRRNPAIQVRLAERINGSLDIVTEAIRFGCFAQVIVMSTEGCIVPGTSRVPKKFLDEMSEENQRTYTNIDRLGHWLALVGSSRTTFDMMGLEL